MSDFIQLIASGWNNAESAVSLPELNSPMFEDLILGVKNNWHPYVTVRTNGISVVVTSGLPWDEWIIPVMTPAEVEYFISLGPRVTIYTQNKTRSPGFYNAIMGLPDFSPDHWGRDEWEDLEWPFHELREIF